MIWPGKKSRWSLWQCFDGESIVFDCKTDLGDDDIEFGHHYPLDQRWPIVHGEVYPKTRMPSNQPAYRRADGDVCRIGSGTDPYQSGLQSKHLLQVACYGARVG